MTIRTAWFFQAFFKESSLLGPDMDKGLRAGSAGNLEKDRQVRFVSLTTYSYSKFLCTESHFQIKYKVLCFFLYEKKWIFNWQFQSGRFYSLMVSSIPLKLMKEDLWHQATRAAAIDTQGQDAMADAEYVQETWCGRLLGCRRRGTIYLSFWHLSANLRLNFSSW